MLPIKPGSKKATWTLSQFSRYTAPFHCRRWLRNSVFQPISLFVNLSDVYDEGTAVLVETARAKALRERVIHHDIRRDMPGQIPAGLVAGLGVPEIRRVQV